MLDKLIRLVAIRGAKLFGIPLQLLTNAVCHIAKENCLSQRSRVVKVACGGATGLAGVDPFLMMTQRFGDCLRGTNESCKLLFREKHVMIITGEQHSFLANE